jgi:SNF2 family DNA or RNA helicase
LPSHIHSNTVRWFALIGDLARAALQAERLRPHLATVGHIRSATWLPIIDDTIEATLEQLQMQMPPACGVEDLGAFFTLVVDASARRRLSELAWRPNPPGYPHGTEFRAAQTTFRALAAASSSVLYRTDDLESIDELAPLFADEVTRAHGLAVVGAQLRLHLPDDADDPWKLALELVDVDSPERWCTAGDVQAQNHLALDVAGERKHFGRLHSRLAEVAQLIAENVQVLRGLADDSATVVELNIEQVEQFLAESAPILESLSVRLLGPEQLTRAQAQVRGKATPKADGPTSGRLSATALVQWSATIDDSPIDDAQLERAAAAGTSLIHVNGRWVHLDTQQLRATLKRLHKQRAETGEMSAAALIRLAAESTADSSSLDVRGEGWIEQLLSGLPDERLIEVHEPAEFVGALRHYQRRGLSWMQFLGRIGLGGCLADDMGLGKTATTLAHLATRVGPHLVVCPLSVVHNWYAEAARFTPHLQVEIHHGTDRARGEQTAQQLTPADIVVTTYGLLSRDIDNLAEVQWGTLVLDEAQAIKNHLTRAAKAVRFIQADQKLALTGTPVENHLGELWSILDAVNPGLYGSHTNFTERYAKPIQRSGDPVATAALQALTQPFVLRRTKADKTLLPELPDKIEQIAWAALTREQAAMYQSVVDQLLAESQLATGMKRRGMVLAALTRLKQICNHPAHAAGDGSRLAGRSGKLTRFDEIIDDLLETGEQALVFTQFREMGLLLQRHLAERIQMQAPFLHGGLTRSQRDTMVREFQAGTNAPLLLVSLKAGGTGLNLTAASQVVHYDRWWNPAVEDQATDRAWRLGQSKTVLVHKLVCEGTLEERISQLIDDKRQLANSVLGTGESWLTELSTNELRSLISLTPTAGRK